MGMHSWALQETIGTAVIDTGGANNGTTDSSVSLGAAGPGGNYPLAADFSGASVAGVSLAKSITLSRKHDWSLKFWAKQDGGNNEGMILGDRDTALSFVWLSSSQGGLAVRPAHAVEVADANDGLDIVFPLSTSIKTNWTHYELTYDVSGSQPQLTLAVDDVEVGVELAPDGLELRVNTLGGGHTSSAFALNGRLAGVEMTGTEIDHAKPDKIILVIGQSNAEGRFDNHQTYSHPTLFASKFEDGQWSELFDTGTDGEVWPLVATRWLAARNESVGFIYAAEGATGLVDEPDWASTGGAYEAAIDIVEAANVERIDAILWFQGERDANQDVSGAEYLAAIEDLVERLHADLPGSPPLLCGQINSVSDGTTDEIRNAQSESWGHVSIFPGPVTYDIGPLADHLHFTTDDEAEVLADRWWSAIDEVLYVGEVGTPPKLESAVIDGAEITLTYDRELEPSAAYDSAAWKCLDNGEPIEVVSAVQSSTTTVMLTLDQVPSSSAKLLSLASGSSAQGLEVPRGLGSQPALPETFSLTVPAQDPSNAGSAHEVLSVQRVHRALYVN